MENIQMEQFGLMTEKSNEKSVETNENCCKRFIRKKYKCIMLWMLSIISVTQLLIIILTKMDETILQKLSTSIFENGNYTFLNPDIVLKTLEKLSTLIFDQNNSTFLIKHPEYDEHDVAMA
jgi:hypothetical protein